MAMYYSLADVALLGGSFAPLGGQNLIEAIAAGCPVVMGPHTFNFLEACNTAQLAGAALRAADMSSGIGLGLEILNQPPQRLKLQEHGRQWLAASQGAAARQAKTISLLIQ
jgi:3-deoxy-D-manno-octulosonic-acid transferase